MLSRTGPIHYGHFLIFFLVLAMGACSSTDNGKKEKTLPVSTTTAYKKPASSFTDTLIIQGPVAVFFNPDSIQLEKIKAVTSQQVFASNTHDCFFQQRNARKILKQFWPQVKIIEVVDKRFLLFSDENNNTILTDLDANNDMCGLILFKTGKKPETVDMTNAETALHYYFDN